MADLRRAVFSLLIGLVGAALMFAVSRVLGDEWKVVKVLTLLVGLASAAPLLLLVIRRRQETELWRGVFWLGVGVSTALAALYFYWLIPIAGLRADFLIWSESMFVNDVLKLRLGHPLYTSAEDHQSFIYPPGAPLYAWLLTFPFGSPVVALRLALMLCVLGGVALSLKAARTMTDFVDPDALKRLPWMWLWAPALLLLATNSQTNRFISYLHNSAPQIVVMMGAHLLLVKHATTRKTTYLWVLAVVPALGFFVKQSLGIWAPITVLYVLLCTPGLSWPKKAGVVAVTGGALLAMIFGTRWFFGPDYVYWTSTLIQARGSQVNVFRAIEASLKVWPVYVLGLGAAAMILRHQRARPLLGVGGAWLVLAAQESYTNGVAWKVHHLGPATLIAGTWAMAAIALNFPKQDTLPKDWRTGNWLAPLSAFAAGLGIWLGLGVRWMPSPSYHPVDLERYVAAIEKEVRAMPDRSRVLMDTGTWLYAEKDVVQKDSAIPVGDQGMSGTSDFSGINKRLSEQAYDKILLRHWGEPTFWYDWWMWEKSSGIRASLERYYQPAGEIEGVTVAPGQKSVGHALGTVTILIPRPQ